MIRPSVQEGQRASALAFGDPRALALRHALCLFGLLPTGFGNADLRQSVAPLLGFDPADYRPGKMTYDLRRLRLRGLIERIPRSHRYQVTPEGMRIALFFTRAHARFFRTGLSLESPLPPTRQLALPALTADLLRDSGLLVDNLFADLWKQVGMKALLSRVGFIKRSGTPMHELVYCLVLWVWLKAGSVGLFARESLQTFSEAEKDALYGAMSLLKRPHRHR